MGAEVDEALLRDLTEPLLGQLSPAEQGELYPLLCQAYFDDPKAALSAKDGGAGPLAFGIPELSMLLTPVLLATMAEVVRYVTAESLLRGAKASGEALRRLFGVGKGVPSRAAEELTLTDTQWQQVRAIVLRVAQKGGVEENQAELIADAVVGQGRSGSPE